MRESGYYWVKYGNEWEVAHYTNKRWFLLSESNTKRDSFFEEINEYRITR